MISRMKDLLSYKPSNIVVQKKGYMIMCYKVRIDKVKLNKDKFYCFSNNKTRGHIYKLHKNNSATKQSRCLSFAIRSINNWINLPSKVAQAESTDHFKNLVDKQVKQVKDSNHLLCRK